MQRTYEIMNRDAQIIQTDNELRSLKIGSLSITDYFDKVPNTNLVTYALNGLGNEETNDDSSSSSTVVANTTLSPPKFNAGGSLSRYKARLIANGRSQQQVVDYDETFNPVVKPATIHTVLSLTVSHQWPIHQLDEKNNFLHGHLSETVYMHQPSGYVDYAYPDCVCHLQHSLYDLKQALMLGFSDFPAMLHVLDSLTFAMIDLGPLNYFLCIHAVCTSSSLFLSHAKYTEDVLERAHMKRCNSCRTLVDTNSKIGPEGPVVFDPTLYRTLAGALRCLTFTRIFEELLILAYNFLLHLLDADWAGSMLHETLSCSSANAEYKGVSNTVAKTSWVRNLIRELYVPLFTATMVYCDNALGAEDVVAKVGEEALWPKEEKVDFPSLRLIRMMVEGPSLWLEVRSVWKVVLLPVEVRSTEVEMTLGGDRAWYGGDDRRGLLKQQGQTLILAGFSHRLFHGDASRVWNSCSNVGAFVAISMAWFRKLFLLLSLFNHHPHTLRSPSKLDRVKYCTIIGAIRETATISPVKTKSITLKLLNPLFRHDKQKRRYTTTGFLTLTPLPGQNVGELPPITAFTFTTNSPENTTLTNRASTSANPDHVNNPAFIEANYDVLESLLRYHRRQVRNEDLRTELDYYSEERHSKRRVEECGSLGGNLPLLLATYLRRSKNGKPLQSTLTSVYGGNQPSTNSGGNLPPNGTYLSYNASPFIPNSLQPPSNGQMHIYVNPYSQSNVSMTYIQHLNYSLYTQGGNPSFGGASTYHPYRRYAQQAHMSNYGPSYHGPMYPPNVPPLSYPFYAQPINQLPNAPTYPTHGPVGLFTDSTGCVTPFVRWIEDYPFLDRLKMHLLPI
uniref:Ribonuclease H-like domain-containing protein n=1 Tax=Tanacetum cinerariifolium TaxID=118510 RepID=A0A6L2NHQ4_TANCI|nr:ribonuclease H-like domain-containing protein [Tanacetum cinerariifolium]